MSVIRVADGQLAPGVEAAARALAARLTRVIVDLGTDQPRLQSYAAYVSGQGDQARLHLEPIATSAVPPARLQQTVRVRASGETGEYCFTVRGIRVEGETRASVPLAGARLEDLPPRRDARARPAGTKPLVLCVPSGLDELDPHVFPVVDLGAGVCAIETVQPVPPGTVLEPVELAGDRRVLRRAAATVLETLPWYTADGHARFRTRLALGPTSAHPAASSGYDRISSAAKVQRVIELAAMVEAPAWVATAGAPATTATVVRTEAAELTLRVEEARALRAGTVRVGFELFGTSYEMDVRVLRHEGTELATAYPLLLRRRRQRREERTLIAPSEGLEVELTNPATALRERHVVRDLSPHGLCFAGDVTADVIWPGMPLEDAVLCWPGGHAAIGDIEVRSVETDAEGTLACHATMSAPDAGQAPALVDLLGRLRHPMLPVHAGEGFREMIDLYLGVGLFGPHMVRNLPAAMEPAERTWRRLHQGPAAELCRTLEHREDGVPMAAVSAVRAWERSWVIQHMVASPKRRWRDPGALHLAYLDYVLPRSDGHHLVVFVKADNDRITTFLDRFFELSGTPEAVSRRMVELWCALPDQVRRNEPGAARVRPMHALDETLVAQAAERVFGTLGATALSMTPSELRIPDTERRFGEAGVERGRDVSLVGDGDAYALLHERAAAGFNLTWMINASWILPVHPETDEDGSVLRAAIDEVSSRPATPAGDRFVIVPTGTDPATLQDAGYHLVSPVQVNFYNRAGLHRWSSFLRETYGEIAAQRRGAGGAR